MPVSNSTTTGTNVNDLRLASAPTATKVASSPQTVDESEWTLVGAKNKKPPSSASQAKPASNKPIFGVRESTNNKVKAITVNRSWHCKISRLALDVTIEGVKEYMAVVGVIPISIESLTTRKGQPAAMHVEVLFSAKENVMNSDFWPSGVRVDGWRFLHNRKQFTRLIRNWEYDY
jgi:hypothetical protein